MQPTRFEIPEQMRDAANRSVDQAKKAFEQFLDAVGRATATAEVSAKSLGMNTADFNRQARAFVVASFDFVQRLAQARTFEEMTALQQDFLKRQMEAIASKSPKVELTEAEPCADEGGAASAPDRLQSRASKIGAIACCEISWSTKASAEVGYQEIAGRRRAQTKSVVRDDPFKRALLALALL